ncbi:NitT/TauT family transport system substrate-binding protein [Sinosporangium album]|uniref:NitT/TauT family transport system substrate-binding protein n=1 Tax=Sinosporangium album TaxID=504805 RepID=A0A1G7ZVL8_9ACTN|nr:ABC transporter substrate-binding protein [Sinosporangium album]SDH12692.1 NitT/TauT family transport system substrate-binding protein [Sinosporangium album]
MNLHTPLRCAGLQPKRTRVWRLRGLATALSASLLLVSACGTSDTAEPAKPAAGGSGAPETKSLTVGYLPTADYLPVFVAVQEGYFKEVGLEITTKVMPPGAPAAATVGGSLDVGGVPWTAHLLAMDTGIPIVAVAGSTSGVPKFASYLVPNDSDIKSPADLVGRSAAVSGSPGNCDMLLEATLNKEGVPGRPKYVQLGASQMEASLSKGDIEAACVPQPIQGSMLATGKYRVVFDVFGGDFQGFPLIGYNIRKSFVDQNPNTVAAFRKAIVRASDKINSDPAIVQKTLPTYTQYTADQAKNIVLPKYTPEIDRASLEKLVGILQDLKVVKNKIELPQYN